MLSFTDNTLKCLEEKHHQVKPPYQEIIMTGNPVTHPIMFEEIDEETIKRAAIKLKGGSGLSGLHLDWIWRKTLTLNVFRNCTIDLYKALTDFIEQICINEIEIKGTSLAPLLAWKLEPPDKKVLAQD